MPRMTFVKPFAITDKAGIERFYYAGEQDVPQDVADSAWAQAHTEAGVPGLRKAPETEEDHGKVFEHLAKRAEAVGMALQPASDPAARAAGTGLADASPSADNEPALPSALDAPTNDGKARGK